MAKIIYPSKKLVDLSSLFASIEGCKLLNENGSVSFKGFEISDLLTTLSTYVGLNKGVPPVALQGMVFRAVSKAGERGPIDEESFLKALKGKESTYLKMPPRHYYFYTSLSFVRPMNFSSAVIRGTRFNFRSGDIHKFKRDGLYLNSDLQNEIRSSALYTRLYFSIRARCPDSAATNAFDQVDLLRGIWNMSCIGYSFRMSSGVRKPVNPITLGPLHTLHSKSGALATETHWYEPFFSKAQGAVSITEKFVRMRKFERKLLKSINASPYQSCLVNAVIRYCRALDQVDYEASFLKLWGVLEFLTNTTGGSYDTTIKRTAFLFKDGAKQRPALEHLRAMRNRSVHGGDSAEQEKSEQILYQLKYYVEQLFFFHFFSGFGFESLAEAGIFLDTSTDRGALEASLRRFQRARKFLGIDED